MPIARKWVAQDTDETHYLRIDYPRRYIQNTGHDWQPLFGPNSAITSASRILKLAAEFNAVDFSSIRLAGYLFNQVTGAVDNASACEFSIYLVTQPNWNDVFHSSVNGVQLSNQYWYANVNLTSFAPGLFDGSTTLMLEAKMTRLSEVFRDRVYVNHLGIYDSFVRLKQEVEFLDLTKLDE